MIINISGIVIRIAMSNLRSMGRATQGVRLIKLKEGDAIASVAKVEHDDEEEVDLESVVLVPDENDILPEVADAVEEDEDDDEEEAADETSEEE